MKDSIIKYIASMKQNFYRLSKLINNIVDSSKIVMIISISYNE